MSTRQKFILIFLSVCLAGILPFFSILVLNNNSSASPENRDGDNQDISTAGYATKISPESSQQVPPQAATGLNPSLEFDALTLPPPILTVPVPNTDTPISPSILVTTVPCPISVSGGLVTEIKEIIANMPQPGSNGFVQPTDEQITNWESLIDAVINDDIPAACSIIRTNGFPYEVVNFIDTFNENQQYIILRENTPVQAGWGTFVFRTGKNISPLVVEVPHPVADWNTEIEGVEIFRKTGAQALLIAGTHRCANDAYSACSGETIACGQVEPYRISDVGHGVQNMFHVTHGLLVGCRSKTVAIQLHGNSLSNCPDVFVSNGTVKPGAIAENLSEAVTSSCRDYTVDLADGEAGECSFTGGGSPQAVLTNSCRWANPPDACTGYTLRPSGPDQFLSIEQSIDVRKDFGCVIDALEEVFIP